MIRRAFVAAAVGLILAALQAPGARGEETGQTPAQSLLWKGRYDEAAERFAKEAESDPVAAIGLAQCRVATGKGAEARTILEAACERFPKSAGLQAEMSNCELARGEYDLASQRAKAALALDKDCVAARWVTAELLRHCGQLENAENAYRWFVDYYNR